MFLVGEAHSENYSTYGLNHFLMKVQSWGNKYMSSDTANIFDFSHQQTFYSVYIF